MLVPIGTMHITNGMISNRVTVDTLCFKISRSNLKALLYKVYLSGLLEALLDL
jgi:hypothetical protein